MRSRVRTGLRAAGLLAAASALCAAIGTPASAAPAAQWQPDLAAGQGTGAVVDGGQVRFDPATAHGAPAGDTDSMTESSADPSAVVPTGLFTLQERTLDTATSEVSSTLDAKVGPGSTATLDVRGRRAGGGWTEWVPSTPGAAPGTGVAALPEPVREVQGRLVLTSTGADRPSVEGVTLTAAPATEAEGDGDAQAEAAPLHYSVFATREGLVGGTTANGHKIANRDRFVALPSRRALSPNGKSDYSVKVCAPNGKCAFAPVWDIGPWNTKDDYWNPSPQRQQFKDLPQGVPQAQAAFRDGHNGGKDGFGRKPSNPAGIDLGDGIFWDALGLKDNSQVTVDYLWTGNVKLSKVSTNGTPDTPVRAAPATDAAVVGIAADTADVPVQCKQPSSEGDWVRVGQGQYLPASQVEGAADNPACSTAPAPPTPDATAAASGPATASTGSPDAATPQPGTTSAQPGATDRSGAAAAQPGATTARPRVANAAPESSSAGPAPVPGAPAAPGPVDPASAPAPTETGTHQAAGTTGSSTRAQSGT
ncbi:hypothetical protein [Pseudonocardia endophytica]|uniref:SH3 domain-containing protein n=1 Tax=Pseudonocardia endophytica TaxID=401976 RepID=A0A4R1HS70_PSEEN|nr:hypothetical protein [Pseudonocardia endophytica]TCK20212.1 hypothetical protein EV378_4162 [Pseudonocardia endophytica]